MQTEGYLVTELRSAGCHIIANAILNDPMVAQSYRDRTLKFIIAPNTLAFAGLLGEHNLYIDFLSTAYGLAIIRNHFSTVFSKTAPAVPSLSGIDIPLDQKFIADLVPEGNMVIESIPILLVKNIVIHEPQLRAIREPKSPGRALDVLWKLFKTDSRLVRTIPTRQYRIDYQKYLRWRQASDPRIVEEVDKRIEYHFDQWMESLAHGLGILLDNIRSRKCPVLISTGRVASSSKQSASELWMFYIFDKFMAEYGYTITLQDPYWARIESGRLTKPGTIIVVLDDLVRTGAHMTQRLFDTPGLDEYLKSPDSILVLVAPIMVVPEIFIETFREVSYDLAYGNSDPALLAKIELMNDVIKTRTVYATEIFYDIRKHPYIIVDHNGTDKYETEISGGFTGNPRLPGQFLGSLLEGADPTSDERYPPPLYYLEFSESRRIPKRQYQLVPVGDTGYYDIKM